VGVAPSWNAGWGLDDALALAQEAIAMKQKKRYGAALATEAMTVQLGATYRKARPLAVRPISGPSHLRQRRVYRRVFS
jgi:hypothetical protein